MNPLIKIREAGLRINEPAIFEIVGLINKLSRNLPMMVLYRKSAILCPDAPYQENYER